MEYKFGDICPNCEEGKLADKRIVAEFQYKGQKLEIEDYLVWECSECREKYVDRVTSKESGRRIRDFHRSVDGLLPAAEITRIRKFKLCRTQDEASFLLGGGAKSFNRYENCEVIQSESMDNLLRVLDKYPEAIKVLESKYGIRKKPVEYSMTAIIMGKEKPIKIVNG